MEGEELRENIEEEKIHVGGVIEEERQKKEDLVEEDLVEEDLVEEDLVEEDIVEEDLVEEIKLFF